MISGVKKARRTRERRKRVTAVPSHTTSSRAESSRQAARRNILDMVSDVSEPETSSIGEVEKAVARIYRYPITLSTGDVELFNELFNVATHHINPVIFTNERVIATKEYIKSNYKPGQEWIVIGGLESFLKRFREQDRRARLKQLKR